MSRPLTEALGGALPGPPRALWSAILVANALLTGVLLGVLQWSAFFLLQSYLSSTAVVYLLATAVWLGGSLLGLALPGRRELPFLGLAVAGFELFRVTAARHPYALGWLPALLGLVALMGLYAGRFFRCRAGAFPSSKWLFFLENSGFAAGMVLTALALYRSGEGFFRVAPGVAALAVAATTLALGRARGG